MAENLGEAQLRLTVDTGAVDKELKRLRDAIQNFSPDFKAVKAGLRTVSTEAKAAADSTKSLAFNLNQATASKLEGINKQIKDLQGNLRGARIQSEDFLSALTRIQELEGLRDIRVGRQSALAGQRAYSPEGALGQLDQAQQPQLPLTLAGERQNIDELKRKLSNLDYESSAYAETLRVLQRAQERYNNLLNGTSSEYQKLAQQEEAAIRRAEKLAGIQSYYADKNPRAGGVRDESGAMLARGAGSASDERAYQAALRPARELLNTDLQRSRVLREISQRILASARSSEGGFGAASASNFGTTDPVTKSIRRNAERSAQRLERVTAQREALESDLLDVQARRVKTEEARANLADRLLAAERSSSGARQQAAGGGALGRLRQNAPNAVSSALIGGAFPALFGQGAGASVGGALGGALGIFGGGFGFAGSLIGTAIGQQADNLSKLSQALQEPIARFQELKDSALLSSRSLEKNIEALINAGRYAEAEAKIREDLSKRGLDAATANRLAAESDELKRSLAELGVSIGLVVQGPLTDLIKGFNKLLRPGQVAAQSRAIQAGLSPEDRTAYQDRRRELNRGGLNILDANEQANTEFASRTRAAKEAQEGLTAAKAKDNELTSAQYRLIDANVQGYQRLALERQKELVIAEKVQALAANPANAIQIEQDTARKLYEIEQQLRTISNFNTFAGLNAALAELENKQTRLSVDSSAFEIANQQILETQNALEQLDGKKAIITVEQINAGVQNGSLTNNFNNLERRAQAAQQALNSAQFGSADFQKALRATQEANFELDQRRQFADPNALSKGLEEAKKQEQQASEGVSSALQRAQQAADALAQAQKNFRSALEGSFDFLTREYQQSILAQAKESLSSAVGAGFFDRGKVQDVISKGSSRDIISAANQARSVLDADKALKEAKIARAESEKELIAAINALKSKDWNVNVDTSGSPGASVSSDLPRGVEVYQ